LSLPSFTLPASNASTGNAAANVVSDGQTQIMRMAVGYSGYSPNRFTIKAGLPTRWEIDGTNAGGCGSVIQSRALGIQKALSPGQNVIAFTAPQQPGTYQFSCSMGMYRGQITVVPNT
jgi:plastocyanin domain-containing protein